MSECISCRGSGTFTARSFLASLMETSGFPYTFLRNVRKYFPHLPFVQVYVGVVGLEPTILWSQTRCSSQLSHTPILRPDLSRDYES